MESSFQDTIIYQPDELLKARNKPASKEYTGPRTMTVAAIRRSLR